MTNNDPSITTAATSRPVRRSRLWMWFGAGFLLAFVVPCLAVTMYYYDGHALLRTKLWHFYVLEIRRAWNSTGNLGPTTGSTEQALLVLVQHLLFSGGGGAIMTGIGWGLRKVFRRA